MSVTEPYPKTLSQIPKNDFFLKSTPSFGSPTPLVALGPSYT